MDFDSKTTSSQIPEAHHPFAHEFERLSPRDVLGSQRHGRLVWNGRCLFMHYDWLSADNQTIAAIRIQYLPGEKMVWIGDLEVYEKFRERRIGSQLIQAVEGAARRNKVAKIRLFSVVAATQFWLKQGFSMETDPRFMQKTLVHSEIQK